MADFKTGATVAGNVIYHAGNLGSWNMGTTGPTATTRLNYNGYLYATKIFGTSYNDYAEFRLSKQDITPGYIVTEVGNGDVKFCEKRLSKACMIVSDTYGFVIGEQNAEGKFSLPIAVAGRVLAFTDQPIGKFKVGDAVCSGKNGGVCKMRWFERILYPERIIGTVSEIPKDPTWGPDKVSTAQRIWIKVR
jgi:hypothetical protein